MIVGLLGDIHGNHHALQAVLSAARSADVEKLLVTGDLIGYYFWPERVLDLLDSWDKVIVRGNHEQMLADVREHPDSLAQIESRYGSGLRLAMEQLPQIPLDWLTSLPHPLNVTLGGVDALVCHGTPWDIDEYVYPEAAGQSLERCGDLNVRLLVLGHTHYPMVKVVNGITVVNPGSVGQPRNSIPGAHWAVWDTARMAIDLRCEKYDYQQVVAESRVRHPELPYLANVLSRT